MNRAMSCLCAQIHVAFESYNYFIRFCPDVSFILSLFASGPGLHKKQVQKFVLINYSDKSALRPFHGKAIALDIKDRHAPFPSISIIHEMRVRGHNPFSPVDHILPNDIPWQDWILSEGMFDDISGSFKREPLIDSNNSASAQAQIQFQPTTSADVSSGQRTITLNADVIADILAATHAMPSWKACQMEGTSWTGTTEENIQKYKHI
jgi:hypothetical protein